MAEFFLTLVVFIFVIGILVFVHELGHYLAARFVGIRVEEFAIGMGPKVYGFNRNGTEYNIRILPIGGYVKMFGEGDYDVVSSDSYGGKTPLQRLLVLVAGVFMNLILAVFLLYIQGIHLGFQYRVVDSYFSEKYNPWFGEKKDNLLVIQDIEPYSPLYGRIDKFYILLQINGEDYSLSDLSDKILRYSGQEVQFTFIGYIANDSKNVTVNLPEIPTEVIGEKNRPFVVINGFTEDSILKDKADIGDIIKSINGESYDINNFVQTISSLKGQNIKLSLISGIDYSEKEIEISLPNKEKPLGIVFTNTQSSLFLLGINASPISFVEFRGWSVLFAGIAQTLNNIQFFGFAMRELLRMSFDSGSALPIADNVTGALGLFDILSRVIKDFGFWGVIDLMILFSINLAVINMLPIPALDGGHVLFTLIELISRRRLNTKIYNYLTIAGFAFLIFLMISITYMDIIRFTSIRKIFCNESVQIPFVCDLSSYNE